MSKNNKITNRHSAYQHSGITSDAVAHHVSAQSIGIEPVQKKILDTSHHPQVQNAIQLQEMANRFTAVQPNPITNNNTGLPLQLKTGIEHLSGVNMNDVKVHYNSSKPAQLHAHAYAQGNNIHIGPGQERHLPHEAWHVVQQKQARVKPTIQLKAGISINNDVQLEKEADTMGARAAGLFDTAQLTSLQALPVNKNQVVQGFFTVRGKQINRAIEERVDAYLQRVRPDLVNEFSDGVLDQADRGELANWLHGKGLDTSIVGKIEEDDEKGQVDEIVPIREIFNQVARRIGIKDKNIWDIVSDLDVAQQYQRAESVGNVRQLKKDLVPFLKKGWEAWTSCFDTSLRLYNLMSHVPTLSYNAPGNDTSELVKSIFDLTNQIQSIKREKISAVFRVNFGHADHSFTIIAQGGMCEILQSFAGPQGESLGFNIANGKVFDTATFVGHLQNIGKAKAERKASSEILFGGEIMLAPDKSDLWPTLGIHWTMSSLKQNTVIFELIMQKVEANLNALKKLGVI